MRNILELIGQPTSIRWCINLRGCNGSGKTSLARQFMKAGFEEIGSSKILKKASFVLCPKYDTLVIGSYANKCGGCDTLVKEQITRLIRLAWMTPYNIVYEGVLVSDSGKPYLELMREYSRTINPRYYGFAYLDIPLDECLRRIYARNGGKPIKEQLVANKHRNSLRYRNMHQEQEDCKVIILDATKPQEYMFETLMKEISKF